MKKLIILISVFLSSLAFMSICAQAPDFAFPKKVEQKAASDLKAALAAPDGGDRVVNALVRMGLAQTAVSADSLSSVLREVEAVRLKEKDVVTRSMLALLEAQIYADAYNADRWTIDRRPELDTPAASSDITLWGKAQFRDKVLALTAEALANPEALKEVPINEYSVTLEFKRDAITFYPTLFDFAANKAINLLDSGLMPYGESLPLDLLRRPADRMLYPAGSSSPVERRVLELYAMLMAGRENTAPGMHALAGAMQFISPRVFSFETPKFTFGPQTDPQASLQQIFFDAYMANSRVPYAVEILLATPGMEVGDAIAPEAYTALCDFAKNNPQYFNLSGVNRMIATLSRPSVSLKMPQQVAKEVPFTIEAQGCNINDLELKIYRLPKGAIKRDDSYFRGSLPEKPVRTAMIHLDGSVPFKAKAQATVTLPFFGRYIIVPSAKGLTNRDGYTVFNCSDLATAVLRSQNVDDKAVVFSAVDGAPVKGAELRFMPWDRRDGTEVIPGVTDTDGFMPLALKKSGRIYPVLGSDLFAQDLSVYKRDSRLSKSQKYGKIVTSLGLYRPGDTVDFAAVVYEVSKDGRRLLPGQSCTVVMRDANYQEAGTVDLTTDAWGRATGSFTIPEGGLTGQFTLEFKDEDNISGNKWFMVSDYKLPTFEVKVTSTKRPATLGDDAVIEGSALTFAGFPLDGAKVKAQLRVRTGAWWFATVSPVFYETTATADAAGNFSITVPGGVISASPCPQGYFLADIAVTSPDGETHQTTASFNMGKPCYINADIPAEVDAKHPLEAKLQLTDYDGKKRDGVIVYKIAKRLKNKADDNNGTSFGEVVKEGSMQSGNFAPVLASLPSGCYGVIFDTQDKSLADPTRVAEVTVWRPDDKVCAADRLLWVSSQTVKADAMGKAAITVGSNAPGNHVLIVTSDDNGNIVDTYWIKLKSMQTVDVRLPQGCDRMKVSLTTIHNCESAAATVWVESAAADRHIEVHTTTFRDKVVPGDKETVTLRISATDGVNPESAVMLDMSNKAIDVLQPNQFGFTPVSYFVPQTDIHFTYFPPRMQHYSGKLPAGRDVVIEVPDFRMYGRDFASRNLRKEMGPLRVRGTRALADAEVEVEMADEAVLEETVVTGYAAAAPMNMAMQKSAADAGAGAVEEEAAESKEETPQQEEDYRPAELPLAFFRPMLTTDAQGNLEISYTVPDANTTWVLRALAYNRELLTASDDVEIVASKPLMVSTNATRFLRCGDVATLPASVMNATDSAIVARTVCELLDATGSKVVASTERTDTLAPKGRAVVSVDFNVPETLTGVVMRVRSTSGRFTDGEQAFIPVLPSEQSVVESTPFYLAPGENHFTMELPQVKKGRAYLRYTGNPAWEVVLALPGLRNSEFTSSVDAAGALYSAAVADGLMKQFPEIARTIRRWAENPSDSSLVSHLSRDSELKTMLLNATPWVADALSDTERMQRLVLLLDSRNTQKVVNEAMATLSKTFVSDEGWCWTEQYPRTSEWATMQVLDILGGLNLMGWLPDNKKLSSMIEKAVKYLDAETVADYRKYPDSDYSLYCYFRLKYPEIKLSTAAKQVVNAQVRRILSSWKDHSVVQKAVDAQIIHANGYEATAKQILNSLTQYATYTPQRGMWWDQLSNRYSFHSMDKVGSTAIILDAYAMVSPGAQEIDRIRQWLVLNKTDNAWGNAIITSQVITTLLRSGAEWTVLPEKTAVRVGSTLLEPGEEYATGSFTEQITHMLQSPQKLIVDRQGNYPSFGALVTMRVLPMEDVKAFGTDDLKVEKYLTVYRDGKWVPSETFAVGDRVKVALTIKADKDMSYVVIADSRAAALEPVEQLPRPVYSEGLCFYRENRDTRTNLFIDFMPKGVYLLEYELFASQAGTFSSGVAQVQSQYNPVNAAHSAGSRIVVR